MSLASILAPLFAQILLVAVLSVVLGKRRLDAVKAGLVKMGPAVTGETSAWPKQATLASNAFNNQFQFPILFYVLMVLAVITRKADVAFVVMAWVFVASRYAHAFIHVTTNRMPGRFYAFIVGVAVLVVMWIIFAFRILASG